MGGIGIWEISTKAVSDSGTDPERDRGGGHTVTMDDGQWCWAGGGRRMDRREQN